ncbi:MAG: orotate phosphoribosyltransferase, partial [Campylobacteraceae bacterium]|nr:orotate phosphoribosyltransferase [Campylobacteraceae bacterium]
MNVKQIYKDANALLEGHCLLSSGNHSKFYLQSAKILEDPQVAQKLTTALAKQIKQYGLKID